MNPHYHLHRLSNRGSKITRIEFTEFADRPRATALMRGVNGRAEWHVTPARANKWAALYDAGWGYDDRGFYCVASGARWLLSDAMNILADREALCSR